MVTLTSVLYELTMPMALYTVPIDIFLKFTVLLKFWPAKIIGVPTGARLGEMKKRYTLVDVGPVVVLGHPVPPVIVNGIALDGFVASPTLIVAGPKQRPSGTVAVAVVLEVSIPSMAVDLVPFESKNITLH